MSKIIDLAAFQPEPLEIKFPNGNVYTLPATISVEYMTKLMALQEKVKKVKSDIENINILQQIAVEILSLDKTKTVTIETVKSELDDIKLLSMLPKIFHDYINENANNAMPVVSSGEENPNTNTPVVK
jgi:hypothetical protein